MGLYKPTDQQGQPLNTVYAEDVCQFVDVLTGQRDAGALSLLAPLASPAAPAVTLQAGAITGTGYKWGVYWITGVMDGTGGAHVTGRTPYGTLTAAQALSSQQATVSIAGLTVPTGAIGWGVARNKSGGSTWYEVPGSEQFLNLAGNMPASFVDDAADASLVTAAPTANTTGTNLPGSQLDYAQITANSANVTATTEATAQAVITGNSIAYDGSRVRIEAWVPFNATDVGLTVVLLRDSTVLGQGQYHGSSSPGSGNPVVWALPTVLFDTPAAGAHTYALKAFVGSAASPCWAIAGPGGSGQAVPAFLRVTRA